MGRKRKGRAINGVILIDKPQGMSSNAVVQTVKRLFNAQKAGHTGALDPLATGMLPVCLGEATKFSQYLLDADKAYFTTAQLGVRTDTSDADGEIVETLPVDISQNDISVVIDKFKGESLQTPSIYSALKYEGKPLYHYARKGIEVPRPTRKINVHKIKQVEFNEDLLSLEVVCSKGTYIRTIIDDIGQLLGCGAHVKVLRRLWVSGFENQSIHSIENLMQLHDENNITALDDLLLPMDIQIAKLTKIILNDELSQAFTHGMQIDVDKTSFTVGDSLRVYDERNQQLLGIAKVTESFQLQPKRVVVRNHPENA